MQISRGKAGDNLEKSGGKVREKSRRKERQKKSRRNIREKWEELKVREKLVKNLEISKGKQGEEEKDWEKVRNVKYK